MFRELYNLIKRAVVTKTNNDTGHTAVTQLTWNKNTANNVELLLPYGLCSNAPESSIGVMFSIAGLGSNRAAIVNDPKNRFKNLKVGEVALGNYKTKSVIKFLENGDIDITSLNDCNINVTGNVTINVNGDCNNNVTGNNTTTVGGDCNVNVTGNTDITCAEVKINGLLKVTGEITAFDSSPNQLSFTDIKTTYNSHTHNEVDNAPAPTQPPNQPL